MKKFKPKGANKQTAKLCLKNKKKGKKKSFAKARLRIKGLEGATVYCAYPDEGTH